MGAEPPIIYSLKSEKQQLSHRVSTSYLNEVLQTFNQGQLDAVTAAERLTISVARLYQLRHRWLQYRSGFQLGCSGGSHRAPWPKEADEFLAQFLPHCEPVNFALIADELAQRFGFQRSRAAIAAHVRLHFPNQVTRLRPGPKPRRRWQAAAIGELWQHDSSPHQWWSAAERYPVLILTIDDHSRKIVAGTFVRNDTTWDHFIHLRACLETFGLPACLYTDGLSLFGHRSPIDRLDTHSQFQRAFGALGVTHRVAPDAPAKGKIERRFDTFQKRLVTLCSYEKVSDYSTANTLLQTQITWHNQRHVCRTTGLTPDAAWDLALKEKRSHLRAIPPACLMDLHMALHLQRRLNADYTVDFLGRSWHIAPTKRKVVTVVHHPTKRFWIVPNPPEPQNPVWPNILAAYTL